ncbi:MAG: hypothetical protein LQ349_007404 [Xanthoria aureola]|nr:MAG: hypothetical protein LQ349_007404 [Xanthoria aureola]
MGDGPHRSLAGCRPFAHTTNECFCTMSGNEVVNPAMSKEDRTATSELLGENHREGIDNDAKAPGNQLASDSQSASKVGVWGG